MLPLLLLLLFAALFVVVVVAVLHHGPPDVPQPPRLRGVREAAVQGKGVARTEAEQHQQRVGGPQSRGGTIGGGGQPARQRQQTGAEHALDQTKGGLQDGLLLCCGRCSGGGVLHSGVEADSGSSSKGTEEARSCCCSSRVVRLGHLLLVLLRTTSSGKPSPA